MLVGTPSCACADQQVMAAHAGAVDAGFLIEEGPRIQQLVKDYVLHIRGREVAR